MIRKTRATYLAATGLAVLVIGISVTEIPPRLIWNASASIPIGLYRLEPPTSLALGDLVAVTPPEPLAQFITARGYIASGVPLLKRVAALSGTRVCRIGTTITVDGQVLGQARDRDLLGRSLPVWQGCRLLAGGEVFLMNREAEDSLDGRYFSPLPVTSITARIVPLWTDAAGDGRFRRPATGAETAPDPTIHHQATER
ncbi:MULTISPECIES: S26 family signal peptidase [Paracoccus]|uniref:Conjugation peptidase TraF n=1 Tax=Paracoccus versutus TaxID=34007 RepID=A0AAQ0HF35_PARVE|nr:MULTISPECIES: S26 family signal peptidase [Paracoccus]KGJ12737.1 peptidase S26 [Paracoccus versutus]REG38419.1 conjugation peptidase TraF [Paracoccus versutus]SMG52946.1 conjugation peptidase TraF. Serine peptidase. MEROPS family S26C [Paracoccus sp. J56]